LLAAGSMSIDQMPKLYEGTDATGRLTPAVAKAWGMPKRPVVAGGGGDNAAAACGIGAVTDPVAWNANGNPANFTIRFDVNGATNPATTTYDLVDNVSGNSLLTGAAASATGPYLRTFTPGSAINLRSQGAEPAFDFGATARYTTAWAKASASSAGTPDLLGPPSILTWIHTCSRPRAGGRWALKRSAILSRSMDCTQSKCSATKRVLLLCTGPMQCHCSGKWASAWIFSTASWM
jgi:hypothetical protein